MPALPLSVLLATFMAALLIGWRRNQPR